MIYNKLFKIHHIIWKGNKTMIMIIERKRKDLLFANLNPKKVFVIILRVYLVQGWEPNVSSNSY